MFNTQNQLKDTQTAINAEQIIWLKGTRFRSNARNTGWNPTVIMGDCHVFCCSVRCFLLENFMHVSSAMDEGLEDSVTINPYSVL
jgi:hypothetical protein